MTADGDAACAICWDGSLASFENNLCLCPAANIEEAPEIPDETEENGS